MSTQRTENPRVFRPRSVKNILLLREMRLPDCEKSLRHQKMIKATTAPQLSETEPLIWQWAVDRKLIHEDGSPNKATPLGQAEKTLEEIGEAKEAIFSYQYKPGRETLDLIGVDLKKSAALELGDILVTLSIQARMQGSSLDECKRVHYFNVEMPVTFRNRPITWQFVDVWAEDYLTSVDGDMGIKPCIGALTYCVADAAQTQLAMSPEECLSMAYDKIKGRAGQCVDGKFVKKDE